MVKKKTGLFIVKAVVSISLLVFIIINIDWNKALDNLEGVNYFLLAVAVMFRIGEHAELTYKWNLLIWARGINISFGRLFLINAVGGFWGLFLPSSLGTDVARGYYLVKDNIEKSASISSVFVDRILGMFSLLLVGSISLIIAGDLLSKFNIGLYVFLFFIITLILFYFFQRNETADFIKKVFAKFRFKKITDILINLHYSILEYKKFPKTLFFAFIITLLVQITRILTYYFIALAFNITVPVIYFFLVVPVIMLVIMIPVSIGGLGVKEGTFITFFGLLGVSINDAAVISFTNSFINTAVTLLGGVVYLFYNSPPKVSEKKMGNEIAFEKTNPGTNVKNDEQ